MPEERKDFSTLTPQQVEFRRNRNAQRGIVRNEKGEIVWSPEQLKARIAHYEDKIKDNKIKIQLCKEEIARCKEKLAKA